MKYKNLFFDLDDTLWAFSANARDTFEEMYDKYGLGAFFDSFEHFYSLYQQRNTELWIEYGNGRINYLVAISALKAGITGAIKRMRKLPVMRNSVIQVKAQPQPAE